MNELRIKRLFDAEAKRLLSEKKERLTAFYAPAAEKQAAKTDAASEPAAVYTLKQPSRFSAALKIAAISLASLVVITVVAVMPALLKNNGASAPSSYDGVLSQFSAFMTNEGFVAGMTGQDLMNIVEKYSINGQKLTEVAPILVFDKTNGYGFDCEYEGVSFGSNYTRFAGERGYSAANRFQASVSVDGLSMPFGITPADTAAAVLEKCGVYTDEFKDKLSDPRHEALINLINSGDRYLSYFDNNDGTSSDFARSHYIAFSELLTITDGDGRTVSVTRSVEFTFTDDPCDSCRMTSFCISVFAKTGGDENGYYTDDGTYVRENVYIDSSSSKTVPKVPKERFSDGMNSHAPLYTNFSYYFDEMNEPEPKDGSWHLAVVEKVGSVSCFKKYESGRASLAYTISDLRITALPAGCTHYKVGDIVKAVENYAFSPDKPDEVFVSVSFSNFRNNIVADVVMEWGKEYAVTLRDPVKCKIGNSMFSAEPRDYGEDIPISVSCSEEFTLPDGCFYVAGDVYPVSYDSYAAARNDALNDLCVPVLSYNSWKADYLYLYEKLFLKQQ